MPIGTSEKGLKGDMSVSIFSHSCETKGVLMTKKSRNDVA
jgi:hypothetical protein